MNSPTQTLQPPAGLVVTDPHGTDDPPLFCLFTQAWLQLRTFTVQTLQLPTTTGDFEAKYGAFTDEQQVEGCVAAMQAIHGLSTSFGDPTALVGQLAADPALLQGPNPPAALYPHVVWYATRLSQAANTFSQTLGSLPAMLNPANCGDPAACLGVLTQTLTGPGGLKSTADDQVVKANALAQALAAFNGQLEPSIDAMGTFTSPSGTFYTEVLAAITTDIGEVATYQAAADAAYQAWRTSPIEVAISAGLLILTAGWAWPASAASGGVLGDTAKKARDAYDAARRQVTGAEAEEQKKIVLKLDLDALGTQMKPTDAAAADFLQTVQQVAGIWSSIGTSLAFISQRLTVAEFQDLRSALEALMLHEATVDWQTIAAACQAYTAHSLVSYPIQPFGAPLPPAS